MDSQAIIYGSKQSLDNKEETISITFKLCPDETYYSNRRRINNLINGAIASSIELKDYKGFIQRDTHGQKYILQSGTFELKLKENDTPKSFMFDTEIVSNENKLDILEFCHNWVKEKKGNIIHNVVEIPYEEYTAYIILYNRKMCGTE